jgi:hypothetical protein
VKKLLLIVSLEKAQSRLVNGCGFTKIAIIRPHISFVTPHVIHPIHICPFFYAFFPQVLRGGVAKLALTRAVVELALAHTMEVRTAAVKG